jgi:hypothetical protein
VVDTTAPSVLQIYSKTRISRSWSKSVMKARVFSWLLGSTVVMSSFMRSWFDSSSISVFRVVESMTQHWTMNSMME